jgi:exopolysaccharide biosynthesis predicted pyruvyltransferase EpsI
MVPLAASHYSHVFVPLQRKLIGYVRPLRNVGDSARSGARTASGAYLRLASRYEVIMTDRLHFAVAGILLDRKVVLLPNSYHKNASMYETWLSDLGCGYARSLDEALQHRNRKTSSWLSRTRHFLTSAVQRVRTDLRRAG